MNWWTPRLEDDTLSASQRHVPGGLIRGMNRWGLAAVGFTVVAGFGSWMGWW